MKYYATITSRSRQFEIGGTKESLIQDLKRMKRSGELDGSEIIYLRRRPQNRRQDRGQRR